jgi:hypothetical protein
MAESNTKRKKSKIFKGVFKKKKKSSNKADEETVYDAQFDATSKIGSMVDTANSPLADPLHVILLLMDTKTRRFELLQLEFDSGNAKVKDIFDQIPLSATEPTLKNQPYGRLCNLKGDNLDSNADLKSYISGAGIVIAVPADAKEKSASVARMANPILTNSKVHSMLVSSGLDISDLPSEKSKAPSPIKEIHVSSPKRVKSETPKKKGVSGIITMIAILSIFIHLMTKVHVHYTTPFGKGDTLSSGRSRGKCGLLRFSPNHDCTPASIFMKEDGVLEVSTKDKVIFKAIGPAGGDFSITKGGNILIGGKKPKVTKYNSQIKNTWPFSEGVKVPKRSMFG